MHSRFVFVNKITDPFHHLASVSSLPKQDSARKRRPKDTHGAVFATSPYINLIHKEQQAMSKNHPDYISTTNACKLCKPLGACLAFKGIEGTVPYLHGSQGCATYMRRYIISHYNEPIDIASSSLSEKNAIYGGGPNLKMGLTNVAEKYRPAMIGIATTCLTETIGDDVPMYLKEYKRDTEGSEGLPEFVDVSTPSYSGTHMEGFHGAIHEVIRQRAKGGPKTETVNLLPGFVSSADYRLLREIIADFNLDCTMLPDLSETMDRPALLEYEKVAKGGTPLAAIETMGCSQATLEFGRTLSDEKSSSLTLQKKIQHHAPPSWNTYRH